MRKFAIAVPVIVAACLASLTPAAGAPQIGDLQVCYQNLNWDKRIAACTRVIAKPRGATRPTLSLVYTSRGFAYYQQDQFDQAMTDVDHALRLDPRNAIAYNNRGLVWRAKGDLDRAIADHNEAIRLNPKEPGSFSSRGGTWREKGDFDRAIADFDQAIKLNAKLAPPYAGRGLVWRARGDLDRAIAEYDQAIRLDAKFTSAFTARGQAFEGKGDVERARADYRRALTLPTSGLAGGGRVYVLGNRFQEIARARLAVLAQPGSSASPAASPQPATAPPAPAADLGRRIALVVGNGAYVNAPALANPANDSRSIARNLREMGFEVSDGFDLDRAGMQRLIGDFLRSAATARVAVLFYAGHGIQIDGKNYLLPIDAKIENGAELAAEMTELNSILAGLDDQIRTNIVILDACRDNPASEKVTQVAGVSRSVAVRSGLAAPSGLARGATIGAGTLLAFATAPGQVALDGEGTNSPFSTALARHISTPGLELQHMLNRVRADVVAATKSKQVPWTNSSLLGEIYLVGSPR